MPGREEEVGLWRILPGFLRSTQLNQLAVLSLKIILGCSPKFLYIATDLERTRNMTKFVCFKTLNAWRSLQLLQKTGSRKT